MSSLKDRKLKQLRAEILKRRLALADAQLKLIECEALPEESFHLVRKKSNKSQAELLQQWERGRVAR